MTDRPVFPTAALTPDCVHLWEIVGLRTPKFSVDIVFADGSRVEVFSTFDITEAWPEARRLEKGLGLALAVALPTYGRRS
ncbi:hypothetical protein RZS28_00835 [Methylocapsa polymorpha]|uniref:Uncharacterized protein n=1 Tax=Methylocapsa polymorpha TaxID=3080828 RepID=A0ABZ0HRR9_9HYPH|nr:hypothetical protein RZS28_00835 [Methylocapsa sp. RX1]